MRLGPATRGVADLDTRHLLWKGGLTRTFYHSDAFFSLHLDMSMNNSSYSYYSSKDELVVLLDRWDNYPGLLGPASGHWRRATRLRSSARPPGSSRAVRQRAGGCTARQAATRGSAALRRRGHTDS